MDDLARILAFAPQAERDSDSFRIRIENRVGSTYIAIDGAIGDDGNYGGTKAKDFSKAIRGKGPLDVYINSPGGSFFDGSAIYQALRNHRHPVTVEIGALAFSAASLIAMAGDRVRVSPSSAFGIHRAWTSTSGNADALRDGLQWLEKIDGVLVAAYAERTGHSKQQITEWLNGIGNDGTLWTGQEIVDAGFADEVIQKEKRVAASPKASAPPAAPAIAASKETRWAIPPRDPSPGQRLAAAQLRLFKMSKVKI